MIRDAFVAHRPRNEDEVAHGQIRLEHATAATRDEFPTPKANDFFEQGRGEGRADARMKERQTLAAVDDLVDGMWAIFPAVFHQALRLMDSDDLVNHFLEEADHTRLRHIARLDDLGRLNKGQPG